MIVVVDAWLHTTWKATQCPEIRTRVQATLPYAVLLPARIDFMLGQSRHDTLSAHWSALSEALSTLRSPCRQPFSKLPIDSTATACVGALRLPVHALTPGNDEDSAMRLAPRW